MKTKTSKQKNKTYIVRWEESMRASVQAKNEAEACEMVMSCNVEAESAEMASGPKANLETWNCGNCSRPHNNGVVAGISRCDRCKGL